MSVRSGAKSRAKAVRWLLAIVLLAVALHHVAHYESSQPGERCTLCILLTSALLITAGWDLSSFHPPVNFSRARSETRILSREPWGPWSHRGPPSLHPFNSSPS